MSQNNSFSKKNVVKSLVWKFAERCGSQLSAFVVSIILAVMLSPEDYGVLSMLLIFIALSQVIVQSGLGTALIQKKETDDEDYSAVFYISLAIAAVLYIILYFASPFIAVFFDMSMITPTLRVMSVSLFFGAASTVLNSMLVRQMKFNTLFVSNITASVLSGAVGIALAQFGYGVWALVWQYIVNQFASSVVMAISVRWIPRGISSVKRAKPLFKYGYKILIANMISTGYNELRSLVIGKKYDSAALAYYDRGKQFPHLVISNLNSAIDNVMLPVYSKEQNNKERLKQLLRMSMQISSFVIFPLLAGLCIVATPLVSILLTDKWLPCVVFLVLNALTYMFTPLQTANAQVINAMGRSDIFLKLEIIKKTLGIIILTLSALLFDDVIYIAYGGLLIAVLSSLINMFPNTRLLKYTYTEQFMDLLPNIFMTVLMSIGTWSISLVIDNKYLLVLCQIMVGIVLYVSLSVLTKNTSFRYILNMIRKRK